MTRLSLPLAFLLLLLPVVLALPACSSSGPAEPDDPARGATGSDTAEEDDAGPDQGDGDIETVVSLLAGQLAFIDVELGDGVTVAVVDFVDEGADGSDEQGPFVCDRLTIELVRGGGVQVVERARIDEVVDELQFGATDLADQDQVAEFGGMVGASALVTGTIWHRDDALHITARAIETGTGRLVAAGSVRTVPAEPAEDDEWLGDTGAPADTDSTNDPDGTTGNGGNTGMDAPHVGRPRRQREDGFRRFRFGMNWAAVMTELGDDASAFRWQDLPRAREYRGDDVRYLVLAAPNESNVFGKLGGPRGIARSSHVTFYFLDGKLIRMSFRFPDDSRVRSHLHVLRQFAHRLGTRIAPHNGRPGFRDRRPKLIATGIKGPDGVAVEFVHPGAPAFEGQPF